VTYSAVATFGKVAIGVGILLFWGAAVYRLFNYLEPKIMRGQLSFKNWRTLA